MGLTYIIAYHFPSSVMGHTGPTTCTDTSRITTSGTSGIHYRETNEGEYKADYRKLDHRIFDDEDEGECN